MKNQRNKYLVSERIKKIDEWNLYADVVGAKNLGEFWKNAIDEYIKRHELNESQQVIYALKKQAAEMQEK